MTSWDTATDRLLALAAADLAGGLPPRPTLLAHAGDDGLAIAGLRPFGPGELLQPLIELAALLLPLGADRFAITVPGRAWSIDDPIPPVLDEVDLRTTVLTVLVLDGHDRADPLVDGTLHPYRSDPDGPPTFAEPVPVGWPEGPATDAFRHLIARRHELSRPVDAARCVVQFARCLLKGHDLVLAPDLAAHLEALTAAPVR